MEDEHTFAITGLIPTPQERSALQEAFRQLEARYEGPRCPTCHRPMPPSDNSR